MLARLVLIAATAGVLFVNVPSAAARGDWDGDGFQPRERHEPRYRYRADDDDDERPARRAPRPVVKQKAAKVRKAPAVAKSRPAARPAQMAALHPKPSTGEVAAPRAITRPMFIPPLLPFPVPAFPVGVPVEDRGPVDLRSMYSQDPDGDYLCEVYHRTPTKVDGSGDFTWKDPAAATRRKMDLCQYVIGGMRPAFRTALAAAGRKMDAAGLRWSILSGFRDDYRQQIAAGFKAATGNSLHGGSRVTGGYGDGRAADVIAADGNHGAVWTWFDKNARALGIVRPMPGADPAHVQLTGVAVAASTPRKATPPKRLAARSDGSG